MLPVAVAVAAPPTPGWPALDPALESRLRSGEIVVTARADGTRVGADVLAAVAAPPERVWAEIVDFEGQEAWVPDLTQARATRRPDGVVVGSGVTPVPWPISDRSWSIAFVHRADVAVDGLATRVTTWSLVPGSGNLVDNTGFWLVRPWEGGSLVRYVFEADAGLSVPDFLERAVTARTMPKMITGLRAQVAP